MNDSNTVDYYNIKDQTTIHCIITSKKCGDVSKSNDSTNNEARANNRQMESASTSVASTTEPSSTNQIIDSDNVTDGAANEADDVGSATAEAAPSPEIVATTSGARFTLNSLLLPLLAVVLSTCWYFRINFKQLFSPLLSLFLITITFIYALLLTNSILSSSEFITNHMISHRSTFNLRRNRNRNLRQSLAR